MSASEPEVLNSDKRPPEEHDTNCNQPVLELVSEARDNNNKLIGPKVMSHNECLSEPNIIMHKTLPPEPGIENNNKFRSEPKVKNNNESLSEIKGISDKESLSEVKITTKNESPSEMKCLNDKESPSEAQFANNNESPSEIKSIGDKDSLSGAKVTIDDEFLSEPKVMNSNESPFEPKVISKNKSPFEPEIMHYNESESKSANYKDSPSKLEVKDSSEGNKERDNRECSFVQRDRGIHRLGIVVLIFIGFLEDLPVVIAVHYTSVIPMCGVPAKQAFGSGVTLATIISSMLNSLWTMILLLSELCKCAQRGFCICCHLPRSDLTEKFDNSRKAQESSPTRMLRKRKSNWKGIVKNSVKPSARKRCFTVGKIVLCVIIFLLFSTTFRVGFLTMGYVLGFLSLEFVNAGPFSLQRVVFTGHLGSGLDTKPDQAMFIYLYYKLPDWHQVVVRNDSAGTMRKSASFKQVFNRIYIGQLEELSHLRDGTLTKAVPCSTVYPHMNRNYKSVFYNVSDELYLNNCKIIFTLRYHPTNNNWQPFTNFIHDFHKYITLEYGIHMKDAETCPIWFNFHLTETNLDEKMKWDIINYACYSACGKDSGICDDAQGRELTLTNGGVTNRIDVSFNPYLAINNLKNPDMCGFEVNYRVSTKFCDKAWASIKPVKIPQDIQ